MRPFLKITSCLLMFSLGGVPLAHGADFDVSHSVKATGTGFTTDAAQGRRNNDYEASLLYTAKTNVFLSDSISMVASGYARTGMPTHMKGAFVGPNENTSRSTFVDIIELGLRWDGESSSLKIGKWEQNYEFAERLTLLNRYNLGDYTQPLNDVSTGNWLVQWQEFFDSGNLNITVMPYHPATGQPAKNSRWEGVNSEGNLLPTQTTGTPIFTKKPDISIIWEGSAEKFDYALGAAQGQSLYSVSKVNLLTLSSQTEYPYAHSIFGGISWPLDKARFYMEAYYQDSADKRDDDFIRMTTGMSFNLFNFAQKLKLNDLNTSLEFLADRTVHEQSNPIYVTPSSLSRPFQNAIYGVISAKLNNDWTLSQELTRGFSKRDSMAATKLSYSFDDSTSLSMQYTRFDGITGESLFGNWKANDNFTLTFSKDF